MKFSGFFTALAFVLLVGAVFSQDVTPAAETKEKDTCKPFAVCYEDSECGKGKCAGLGRGRCGCGKCLNFLPCSDDSSCGGLKGACNQDLSRCDCVEGFKKNGFATILDAFRNFCNVKVCNKSNMREECFGMDCNPGLCTC
ncbi:hypothetical protein L596_023955 [Steinernema carpocapsae]|uniref:Uncharacterized protein n=1 Tax=Steinernema carpocapsae TaxID=34508 RepID=A0A4U5MFZ1_STECR|nr:hypothetical protein L596_023955 [Steinernema carpocapsae]